MIYKPLEYQLTPEDLSSAIVSKTFTLQLEDRSVFSGTIKNADGSLAANCAVILQEFDPITNTYSDLSLVFTNTQGRFVFSYILGKDKKYTVCVYSPNLIE
ncbi:MAG: hypothetical protein ACRC1P_04430 [Cellulosilyticaceae bacterium]